MFYRLMISLGRRTQAAVEGRNSDNPCGSAGGGSDGRSSAACGASRLGVSAMCGV